MKRNWTPEELAAHFSLTDIEHDWLRSSEGHNLLGLAVQLKCFQYLGHFVEESQTIPSVVIENLADQLGLSPDFWATYDWLGRTARRHRAAIRAWLGYRPVTQQDAEKLADWLEIEIKVHQDEELPQLRQRAYQWLRQQQLEPPGTYRLDRIIRQTLRRFEDDFSQTVSARLSALSCSRLDELLLTETEDDQQSVQPSLFARLKQDPRDLSLNGILVEIEKLTQLRHLHLPQAPFQGYSPALIRRYRRRAAAEPPRELRQHPAPIRYTLLTAFAWQRQHEVTDNLVDLFIQLVHKTRTRAERRVDAAYLAEIQQVRGKKNLLALIAEAALADPDRTVREVIFPVVSEQTLRDLLQEYRLTGTYQQQVYAKMRTSYGMHYRRFLAPLLETLVFRSNNPDYQPVLEALDLLKQYLGQKRYYYPVTEAIPIEGVVPTAWHDCVVESLPNGRQRIIVSTMKFQSCTRYAMACAVVKSGLRARIGSVIRMLICLKILKRNANSIMPPCNTPSMLKISFKNFAMICMNS